MKLKILTDDELSEDGDSDDSDSHLYSDEPGLSETSQQLRKDLNNYLILIEWVSVLIQQNFIPQQHKKYSADFIKNQISNKKVTSQFVHNYN